jgi:predicted exporter
MKWDGAKSVDSNFLALLPETPHDAIVTAASNRLVHATEDRMFWLIGSTSAADAAGQAATLTTTLRDSGLFQRVDGAIDDASISRYAKLFPYRFQLRSGYGCSARSPAADDRRRCAHDCIGSGGVYQMQQLAADPLDFPQYLAPRRADRPFEGRTPMIHHGRAHALLVTTSVSGGFDLDKTARLTSSSVARGSGAERRVALTGIPLRGNECRRRNQSRRSEQVRCSA